MTDRAPKDPGKVLVVKPAQFDGVVGYAIFADCSWQLSNGEVREDERFICGILPPDGRPIGDAADHVLRAVKWLREHPQDPRVVAIAPEVDQIYFQQLRAWKAVRDTLDGTSRIFVSKMVSVWRDVTEVEYLDEPWMRTTETEKEALDKRDAWIAKHGQGDDDDEGCADSAQEAENSHERAPHGSALEGAARG